MLFILVRLKKACFNVKNNNVSVRKRPILIKNNVRGGRHPTDNFVMLSTPRISK